MNFFGHAAIATFRSSDPGFVFGAMLPDFWAMIRARPPAVRDAEVERGVRFHHATDDVFHDSPGFRRLSARAFDELIASGLRRSSARAVAHVGVEILIDGVLAENADARNAYLAALAARARLASDIVWASEHASTAFHGLLDALAARGVSPEHRRSEMVAFRIARALANRPRLALDGAGEHLVRAWAERAATDVIAETPALVDQVRRALFSPLGP